jgi:hypothetical protein
MIKCSNSYFYCPPCWKNFIDNIIRNGYKSYKHKNGDDVPIEVINAALKKYKAMYIEKVAAVPCIIFEDDKCETMFILEWS